MELGSGLTGSSVQINLAIQASRLHSFAGGGVLGGKRRAPESAFAGSPLQDLRSQMMDAMADHNAGRADRLVPSQLVDKTY